MSESLFRYEFVAPVSMDEIEATLLLAIFGTEALHGEARTRLAVEHALDAEKRTCVISAGSDICRDLNHLFVGYLSREFGPDSFQVERINTEAGANVEGARGPSKAEVES